jgi:hypothetical protein
MAAGFDLTQVARSLLNIEVNTIIRDAMTAEQMPPLPHALLDIAEQYADELCRLGLDLPAIFNLPGGVPPEGAPAWVQPPAAWIGALLTDSSDTFERLRWAAQGALTSNLAAMRVPPAKRVLLSRIVNNSDTIKEMFKRFDASLQPYLGKTRGELVALTIRGNSYTVDPADLIALQKIWDIGVEEIVAQTVVHVTGDVTTRVQEALREPGSEPIFAIHRQSVDVSVTRWRDLLDAVKEIAGAAVSTLLGSKP